MQLTLCKEVFEMNSDFKVEFRKRLKSLMDERNLNNSELAEAIGCDPSTISRILNGHLRIREDILFSLSEYFNVSVSYLIGETNLRNVTDYIPPIINTIIEKINSGEISELEVDIALKHLQELKSRYQR